MIVVPNRKCSLKNAAQTDKIDVKLTTTMALERSLIPCMIMAAAQKQVSSDYGSCSSSSHKQATQQGEPAT